MLRRGIIDEATFAQIVREGHTKTKYTDDLLALKEQVLTATDYAGLRLRGWITPAESYTGGALTGYSQEQMDQLWLNRGRPATTHQAFIGLARGGEYDGATDGVPEAFKLAVLQSDIRPEWTNLLWHSRYSYPSAFVLRGLTQSGDLTQAQTEQVLLYEGWEPGFAKTVSSKWAESAGAGAKDATAANLRAEYEGLFITRDELVAALVKLGYDQTEALMLAHLGDAARVKKYRDAVVTAVYKAFLAHDVQDADARATLTADGISSDAIDDLLRVWKLELMAARRNLTPAQIGAAYRRGTLTQADAVAELVARGYSEADADALLGATLPVLTVAQIEAAYKAGVVTRDEGFAQLTAQGYSADQANELLDTVTSPAPPESAGP
jgi:hypothetical protein